MSDQTGITSTTPGGATAGPADPNAPGRAKLYAGLAALTPVLSFLATFGIVTSEQVNAISAALTAGIGLLGAFGFGFAATKTSAQVKNGTFDSAPVLPAVPALEQLAILRDQAAAEVERAVTTVQSGVDTMTTAAQAAAQVLGQVPGGGPAAQAVQELIDSARRR